MDRETHDRMVEVYWDIWNRGQDDPEYAQLRSGLEALEPQFEAIVETLPEAQREVIELYIAHRESMNRRMLELACGEIVMHNTPL